MILDVASAQSWARERGLVPSDAELAAEELTGGVSAVVIALRVPATGQGVVVKQALSRLRVGDEWLASQERTETEADAMRLCAKLTPGAVPLVLASDPVDHLVAIELIEGCVNWQVEVAEGRVHAAHGSWAGRTLGTWHASTVGHKEVQARFGDLELFEQQRLRPFHETLQTRLPELAAALAPRIAELRDDRTCLVHGDYAFKNMLIGASGPWILDFEVAHLGNPLFDLGFFLSFVVLSAIRWEALEQELRALESAFSGAYATAAGQIPAAVDVVAHTGCLVLARTDGKSPASFLDDRSRTRAREVGRRMLLEPEAGLWR